MSVALKTIQTKFLNPGHLLGKKQNQSNKVDAIFEIGALDLF